MAKAAAGKQQSCKNCFVFKPERMWAKMGRGSAAWPVAAVNYRKFNSSA